MLRALQATAPHKHSPVQRRYNRSFPMGVPACSTAGTPAMWKRICQVGSLALVQDHMCKLSIALNSLAAIRRDCLSDTLAPKCGPLPTLAMIGEPADSHMTKHSKSCFVTAIVG